MAISSDLVRWVRSSIAQYFYGIASSNSITFFVDGVDEPSSATMQTAHAELRVQGPYVKNVSKDVWKITCDINIFLSVPLQMSSTNAYAIDDWGGIFMEAMENPINVYRYGDGDTFLGCLRVKLDGRNEIGYFSFGEAGNDTRIRQAEVDASFEMTTDLGE